MLKEPSPLIALAAVAFVALTGAVGEAQWRTVPVVDEFGEPVGETAVSPWVPPIRAMGFPYEDVKGRLRVRCNSVLFQFTELHWNGASLSGMRLSEGRHGIKIRADGEDVSNWFHRTPEPGARILGPIFAFPKGGKPWDADREEVINVLKSAATLAVSIDWYGEGLVAFRWNLNGSTRAIDASCSQS